MSAPYLGVNGGRVREDDEGYSRDNFVERRVLVRRSTDTRPDYVKNTLIRRDADVQENRFAAEPTFGGRS